MDNMQDQQKEQPNVKKDPKDVDKNLNPETRALLDEDFWVDATPQKVQDLISKGADINAENKNGLTAAHFAAKHGDVEILKILGENGADMNHGDTKAETPAHKVAKDELSNEVLKELAKHNANFDQKNVYGETPRQMIRDYQQDADPLLKEIDQIQSKMGESENKDSDTPKKDFSLSNRLQQGSKEGETDPRNQQAPSFKNEKTYPSLVNSQKEY